MRITVIGAAGRLGTAIGQDLAAVGHQVTKLGHSDLDITEADRVAAVLQDLRPQVIVNCSAYNAVDKAESERAYAYAVNRDGPATLARTANVLGALLIHYSTDFVFDGTANTPYAENASPNPISVYGASKLAGEQRAATARRHFILRVESLFGGHRARGHQATVDLIADNLRTGKIVRALADRTVSPSFVDDVVSATRLLIAGLAPFGVYHCVNSGLTTWHDLACAIADELSVAARVIPVMSSEFTTVAPRPRFCALSNRKLQSIGIVMPTWHAALRRHLAAGRMAAAS